MCNLQGPSAHVDAAISPVQTLPRWVPKGDPLYHRRLSSPRFDMCAEALGMPKVALCFLTRGPVHQVSVPGALLRRSAIPSNTCSAVTCSACTFALLDTEDQVKFLSLPASRLYPALLVEFS